MDGVIKGLGGWGLQGEVKKFAIFRLTLVGQVTYLAIFCVLTLALSMRLTHREIASRSMKRYAKFES